MKKLLLIIMLMSTQLMAFDIAKDKQKHLAVSGAISAFVTGIALAKGSSSFESFWIGIGASVMIGVAKEYYDGKNPLIHVEDVQDIYFNSLGAAGGSLTVVGVSWAF